MTQPCQCPLAGYCSRYGRNVGPLRWRLCQTREDYRALWDRLGTGLGDKVAAVIRRASFGMLTEERLTRFVRRVTGGRIRSCGCRRRREWLNRIR